MPSIKFFRYNVKHAAALVILFSLSSLNTLYFPFHLPAFREYSYSEYTKKFLNPLLIKLSINSA